MRGMRGASWGGGFGRWRRGWGAEEQGPLPCFACKKCHRVRYFSRVDKACWNEFVGHLTEGLLYGSEVKRPRDLVIRRKRPMRKRTVSERVRVQREEVLRLLVAGKTKQEVADEMGIPFGRVDGNARKLYRELEVKTRKGLKERAVGFGFLS